MLTELRKLLRWFRWLQQNLRLIFFGKNYVFRDVKKTIRQLQNELTLPVLWKPLLGGGLRGHITGLGVEGDHRGEETSPPISVEKGTVLGHQGE